MPVTLPRCVHGIYLVTCADCKPKPAGAAEPRHTPRPRGQAEVRPAPAAQLSDIWPKYARWNSAIAEEFFAGRWRSRPVYLDLSVETLSRIAHRAGVPEGDPNSEFVGAIKATLSLPPTDARVFEAHKFMLSVWERTQRTEPPWCIGLLAFFSLVAESMARDERFSAANYYGRLCEVLGVTDEAGKRKVQRDFRLDTHPLWDAINSWLDDGEHALGRPTAFAFDHRRHVGIPISQALVKEHDRRRLREFFLEYRLSPRQRLPVSEIAKLLEDWLPNSHVSRSLKELWRQPEARDRIAGITQIELEAWDGNLDAPDFGGRHEAPLLLAANVREHPIPRLELALLVRRFDAVPRGRYELHTTASKAAQVAIRSCGSAVHVRECGLEDWLEIAESADISMPDLLLTSVEFHSADNQAFSLDRKVRRLIVLKREAAYRLFIEAPRAELGETLIILAHRSLAEELAAFLGSVARQGYRQARGSALPGLPEDWVAFRDVVITGISESPIHDLNALTPLATTQISLAGGLALPARSTWHSAHPPEARIVALDEPDVRLVLVSTQLLGSDLRPGDEVELGTISGSGVVDLARLDVPLSDGDYRLVIERESQEEGAERVLTSVGFRLRSATHPRPEVAGRVAKLEHSFRKPELATLSAGLASESSTSASVAGAVVRRPADAAPTPMRQEGELPPERPTASHSTDPEAEAMAPERVTRAESETPPCLAGTHYIWLPTIAPNRRPPAQVSGHCKHCGLEKWFFRRSSQRHGSVPNSTNNHSLQLGRTKLPFARPLPPIEHRSIGWDDLVDSLSYARSGTWQSFVGLATQLDDSPWFSVEAARLLSALGHLDIALEERTMRPETWSMSPTTLAVLDSGDAVLCGARSRRLLARLQDDANSIGGAVEVKSTTFGPSVIRIRGLDRDGMASVAQ